jgi:hypothetical protein
VVHDSRAQCGGLSPSELADKEQHWLRAVAQLPRSTARSALRALTQLITADACAAQVDYCSRILMNEAGLVNHTLYAPAS